MSYKDSIRTVHGPYLNYNEGRRIVIVVYKDGTKVSTSYARYKMQIQLDRKLETNEEVDHKDENELNDDIDNLQVLTKVDNLKKSRVFAATIQIECSQCKAIFVRSMRDYKRSQKLGKKSYCSKRCNGLANH